MWEQDAAWNHNHRAKRRFVTLVTDHSRWRKPKQVNRKQSNFKMTCWKLIGFYPYAHVYWSLQLVFKAKLRWKSGNQKIQYGHQAAISKVRLLKIKTFLPMALINMHVKFEIEIPKQTWLTLRKPRRLQTDGRTDGQGESSIPSPTSLGEYNTQQITFMIQL